MELSTAGYLGIGTVSPTARLHVSSGTGATGTLLAVSTGSTMLFEVKPTGEVLVESGAGNIFSFNPSTGPSYTGTARPSKEIILSPEYPGATLSIDGGSSNQGSMTSDNTGSGSAWRNYYEWSSTQTSLNDYSVLVRVTLPQDFSGWEVGSCPGTTCALEVEYMTGTASTVDNAASLQLNNATDTPGSTVCSVSDVASTSWASMSCTGATLDDGSAPEWDAAGETAVLRLKLKAKSTGGALTRVGDIKLRYKARF